MNHSGAASSGESHLFFKIKQKYVPKGPCNNFNVLTKSNVERCVGVFGIEFCALYSNKYGK